MNNGFLLSRVAESVYWMSRYIERVENTVRLMNVNWHLMLDLPQFSSNEWESLLHVSGDYDLFCSLYDEATAKNVMQFMTFDSQNPNSMLSCLTAARENARSIRDVVTPEMWEQLNSLYLMVHAYDSGSRGFYRNPHEFYQEIQSGILGFYGQVYVNMYRGPCRSFFYLGNFLERADKTTRILDVRYFLLLPSPREVGTAMDDLQWAALLRSASSMEPFVKRYGPVESGSIIQYLLLDPMNPRSLRYCIQRADEALRDLWVTPSGSFTNDAERHSGRLLSELNYHTVDELLRRGLHECLDEFQVKMNQIHNAIREQYFNPDAHEIGPN